MNPSLSIWTIIALCLFFYAVGVFHRNVESVYEDNAGPIAFLAFIAALVVFIVRATLFFNHS